MCWCRKRRNGNEKTASSDPISPRRSCLGFSTMDGARNAPRRELVFWPVDALYGGTGANSMSPTPPMPSLVCKHSSEYWDDDLRIFSAYHGGAFQGSDCAAEFGICDKSSFDAEPSPGVVANSRQRHRPIVLPGHLKSTFVRFVIVNTGKKPVASKTASTPSATGLVRQTLREGLTGSGAIVRFPMIRSLAPPARLRPAAAWCGNNAPWFPR